MIDLIYLLTDVYGHFLQKLKVAIVENKELLDI